MICGCPPLALAGRHERRRAPAARGRKNASDARGRAPATGVQGLGTDLGQTGNPTPADGLQMFVTGLMAEGITRPQIETMGRDVPGALLMS